MGPSGPRVLRFDSGFAAEGCGGGHWTAPLALKVQRVQKVQRVVVSPYRAISMKSALRTFLPAPLARILHRMRESAKALP